MIPYILALLCTLSLAFLINFFRFKFKDFVHRCILAAGSAVTVGMIDYLYPAVKIEWVLFLCIAVSVAAFRLYGAFFSILFSVIYLNIKQVPVENPELLTYPLFAAVLHYFLDYIYKLRAQRQRRLELALHNSKQLNIFREVSYKIQQTMEENQVLQIILTAVTAGYGFSFNRAMIFLYAEDGEFLSGKMATGPLTPEEGFYTWQMIAENRYKLNELFRLKEIEKTLDHPLNDKVRRLSLRLDGHTVAEKAMRERKPIIYNRFCGSDTMAKRLESNFQMKEFAVIPFFHKEEQMGVMFVDNPVNNKPITEEWVDEVLPLTHQASIALYQSKLYNRIEELAKKDGLTGLFNQRLFQNDVKRFLSENGEAWLSLVLIDIDHFKVYNDTNGHVMGNEVLLNIAEILKKAVEGWGHAYRFGGEEFALLLPGVSFEEAEEKAEEIRISVAEGAFPGTATQPGGRLTVSIGVSSTGDGLTMSAERLVETTDEALYKAKNSGKNRVVATKECVL